MFIILISNVKDDLKYDDWSIFRHLGSFKLVTNKSRKL